MASYKIRCGHRALWGGPVFVNGREYAIDGAGYCTQKDGSLINIDADALKLQACQGWQVQGAQGDVRSPEAMAVAASLEPAVRTPPPAPPPQPAQPVPAPTVRGRRAAAPAASEEG